MKSYTRAADAPYAEYVLPVKAGENVVTLRLLPTFPVHAGGTLRYATELLGHDANPVINSIATSANAADWKQNVLRGWATGKSIAYTAAEAGEVKLRIYFMDPGLALQEITIDQPNGNSLTNQYVVNADFELAAEGVEISAENPICLDLPVFTGSEQYSNRGEAFKQSVENATDGLIVINKVDCPTSGDWYYAGYYYSTGNEANFDICDLSGWGPDYGDPQTYLATMTPAPGGMVKSCGIY